MLPNDGLPVLSDAIPADGGDNCHFSYSADPAHTPQLTSIEVSTAYNCCYKNSTSQIVSYS